LSQLTVLFIGKAVYVVLTMTRACWAPPQLYQSTTTRDFGVAQEAEAALLDGNICVSLNENAPLRCMRIAKQITKIMAMGSRKALVAIVLGA
jgi:hypothetical protein